MKIACFLLCALSLAVGSFANPVGPEVAQGVATFEGLGTGELQVTLGPSAIINWQDFSIGSGESTLFIQPSASSTVLNRVTGFEPSLLNGLLQANGAVYLINANGVLIGKEGRVDVASFTASSLHLSDESFLAQGELLFSGEGGRLENYGTIHAEGGDILLIGGSVVNEGKLDAVGLVGLAAGQEVLVLPKGEARICIRPFVGEHLVENRGEVRAACAELMSHGNPYTLAIRHSGTIATKPVSKEGHVYLVADQGDLEVSGEILAPGQEVHLLAHEIKLEESSRVDVSAEEGGGILLVGGSYKGRDVLLPHSDKLIVTPGCQLLANATEAGDGGTVILWSNEETVFGGHIEATASHGSGGFAEVCGREQFHFFGTVDLHSEEGADGTLLLDPKFVTIGASGSTSPKNRLFGDSPSATEVYNSASLATLLESQSVIMECNTDCMFDDNLTSASPNNLTIRTGRSLLVHGTRHIDLGGRFSCEINASDAHPAHRDPGLAQFLMESGSTLTARGAMDVTVGHMNQVQAGVVNLDGGQLVSREGSIRLEGFGRLTDPDVGLFVQNGGQIRAGDSVSLTGTGGGSGNVTRGVVVSGAGSLVEAARDITVRGFGREQTTGISNFGVFVASDAKIRSTEGSIFLEGVGGGGSNNNIGVFAFLNASIEAARDISVTGQARANTTGSSNFGVDVFTGGQVVAQGSVVIEGRGGSGNSSNRGVRVCGANSLIQGESAVAVSGVARATHGSHNDGIEVSEGGQILSGAGEIFLSGTAGSGTSHNVGVLILGNGSKVETGGSLAFLGHGGGSTSSNVGVQIADGGAVRVLGSGSASIEGFAGKGSHHNFGVSVEGAATLTTEDGDLLVVGTGGLDGSDFAIHSSGTMACAGSGNMTLESLCHDLLLGGVTGTARGTMALKALQGQSNIHCSGEVSCAGACMLVANNDIRVGKGAQLTSSSDMTLVVDQQKPAGVGGGCFVNEGRIKAGSGNLAIYAATGPQAAAAYHLPVQVELGHLAGVDTWDATLPGGLSHKYSVSYAEGGLFHGPGFGADFVPGSGNFGSYVVWYKFPLFSPFPPGLNPDVSPHYFLQRVCQRVCPSACPIRMTQGSPCRAMRCVSR